MREIVVGPAEAAKKLANFLKKQFPIGYVRKLFRKNGVRLNGRRGKPDDAIGANDSIQLFIPFEAQNSKPTTPRGEIEIIFEDETLLVIDKPAGLAVHEGKTVSHANTVAGWIERNYRDKALRPLLVHRLDRDTSGLLLLARNENAQAELEKQFETGKLAKEYLALVIGRLAANAGKIESPLPGRDGNLVPALTRYKVIKRFRETTLVRVNIETGRLHQIRLHFAQLGHPVVMDDQHGDFTFNKKFRKEFGLKRQFLHADKMAIGDAEKAHRWSIAPAPDLAQALRRLEINESRAR
ncbi:MAG: RluA family pseudouridine synthase [Deltaproteobacteria bacterium]|nr:RluA family pseudouridine synthase [Deltaproteobacteria bacterium]